MAVKSGFFNSVDGDRLYNADEMSTYFEGLVSDGVYATIGDGLIVRASSGMGITVGTGRALVKMRWLKNDAVLPLTIAAADVQYKRIDAVVLKCDLSDGARAITIEIKQGTPAANPVMPAPLNTQTVKELVLACVTVNRGATAINQSNIADMRGSVVCGWVTGLVKQVDTSELFLQWQTAYENYYNASTAAFNAYFAEKQQEFESWFAGLTTTLGVNTELHKYQSVQTTTAATVTMPLNIPEYQQGDILLIHVGGVLFVEGETEEFTITGAGAGATINFNKTIRADNTITAICIKSVIGSGSDSMGVMGTTAISTEAIPTELSQVAAFEVIEEE